MDFNQEIYKNKTFASLLQDIYKNSRDKEKQIKTLISTLTDMITSAGDAVLVVPLLQGYLEVAVKNDEALIKMAGIVQKALNNNSDKGSTDFLTEEEKKVLFAEVQKLT